LPPPETTSIRLAAGACDSAIFGAERYLREEGFTDVQFTDAATATAIAAGNANIGNAFPQAVFNSVEGNGPKVVALGGLHPGCNEIWAQPAIASLKDLKGSTISVTAKALTNLPYSWMAMALKHAGVDPKDVEFRRAGRRRHSEALPRRQERRGVRGHDSSRGAQGEPREQG